MLRCDDSGRIPRHIYRKVSDEKFEAYGVESGFPFTLRHHLVFFRQFGLPDDSQSYDEFKELFFDVLLSSTPYSKDWRKILLDYVCPVPKRPSDMNEGTRVMAEGISKLSIVRRDIYGLCAITKYDNH
eukprot:augustus_masked-scaffold_2-processed-gene-10.5-mRNA-1 protein AED:1.00 eAED:1.00 QI:0/-1/0/0/-1/1/1/0/127